MTGGLDEPLLKGLFEEAVQRSGAFGAQLSIIKGGEQLDLAAGAADVGHSEPMTTDTLMQIGSITKVFNAAIVFSLVEEGRLDLKAPVMEYLPGFKVADAHATQTLTLRHLMSMSSGLDNGLYAYFGSGDDALERYVANLSTLPQRFPPGRFFGYSNAGACIAGHVAARVAGKPWEKLLRERILEPANLTLSAILDEDLAGKHVSRGHYRLPGDGTPRVIAPAFSSMRARAPSGASLALATSQLARFGQIFTRQGIADTGARILTAESVSQMAAPQIRTPSRVYGHAWCTGPYVACWDGFDVWGHGGLTITSVSSLHWIPAAESVIAFAVNTNTAFGEFSRFALEEILEAALGFARPRFDLPKPDLMRLDLNRYVGTYEQLGTTLHTSEGEGGALRARYVSRRTEEELKMLSAFGAAATEERTALLQPLEHDRFLVIQRTGPSGGSSTDMAFFGEDGSGRATNVLNGAFPMSRVVD